MANDTKTKKGGGWTGRARAGAVSRLIASKFGLKPSRANGVTTRQEQGKVYVHVFLGESDLERKEARGWVEQITRIAEDAGYEVSVSGTMLVITKAAWRFDDMVFAALPFSLHHHFETNAELITAPPFVVAMLRANGWIEQDTLGLTELGREVRAHLLKIRHQRKLAEKRRLRERGW